MAVRAEAAGAQPAVRRHRLSQRAAAARASCAWRRHMRRCGLFRWWSGEDLRRWTGPAQGVEARGGHPIMEGHPMGGAPVQRAYTLVPWAAEEHEAQRGADEIAGRATAIVCVLLFPAACLSATESIGGTRRC